MDYIKWLPWLLVGLALVVSFTGSFDLIPQDSIQYTCSGDLNECIRVNT